MEAMFTGCLVFGVLYVTVAILLGDLIGTSLHHAFQALPDGFQPITLVGGVTAFGGAGLILEKHARIGPAAVVALSLVVAVALSIATHFFYVKPMAKAESSIAYSLRQLAGRIGDVTIPIPSGGFGEVHIASGNGAVHEIAASFEGDPIPAGTKVVVVEIRDSVLYVAPFEEKR